MAVDVTALTFPIMVIGSDGSMYVMRSLAELQTVNALALRKGYYKDLRIIQRDREAFRITDVIDVGAAGPLWGLRWMKPRLRKTRMLLERAGTVSLEDLQRTVMNAINQDRHYWDSMVGVELEDVVSEVRNVRSVDELFTFLDRT